MGEDHFCITIFIFTEKATKIKVTLVESLNQTNMLSRVWRTRFVVQDVSAALQDFSSTPTTDRSFTGSDIALGHVVIYNTFRLSSWSRKWFCSRSEKSWWIKMFLISWQETAATQSHTQSPTRLYLISVLGSDPHITDSVWRHDAAAAATQGSTLTLAWRK